MDNRKRILLWSILAMVAVSAVVIIIVSLPNKEESQPTKTSRIKDYEALKVEDNEVITIEKDPEVDKRKDIRNRFATLITAQHDGFSAGTFGGITNLKIKVRNSTAYVVDNVEVQVVYLKPGNSVYKTETVYAENIKPNSSVVIKAPDSSRGTTVKVNIISVSSRALSLCYESGRKSTLPDDPYVCE